MSRRLQRAARGVTIRAKLIAITVLLVGVIGAIMWLSAASTTADHQRALVDNVAGRQPMLAQRYVAEVMLTNAGQVVLAEDSAASGYPADVRHFEAVAQVTANVGHDAVGRMTSNADAAVQANARSQLTLAAFGIVLALALSWLLGRKLVQR